MNLEYFIARRLISTKGSKSSISAPIIKIAIAAIAIGMIMMIIAMATGFGLQQKIREKISVFSGHIVISNFDDNQSQVTTNPISMKQDFYPAFKNIEGIDHIQPVATKAGIIRTETAFEGIIFKGVDHRYRWKNFEEYLVAGELPKMGDDVTPQVLVSKFLADRLHLKVGDRFNTFFLKEGGNQKPNLRVFTVTGIYSSGFQDFDATYVLGDIRHIRAMNKWPEDATGAFEVFISNFDEISEKGMQVYNETDSTLNTQTIVEKYRYIFEWLQLFDFNIIIILAIMIIVATLNMVVALLVLILERTQMIGILKALGASNWSVRKIFLYNAGYLILRGLLWGNVIGIGLILIQQQFSIITLPPENYYVAVAPVYLDWIYILLLNLGTILICLLVLLIPSYIITRISPVKAIRFD